MAARKSWTRKSSCRRLPGGGPVGQKHRRGAVRRVFGAGLTSCTRASTRTRSSFADVGSHIGKANKPWDESDLRVRGRTRRRSEGRGTPRSRQAAQALRAPHIGQFRAGRYRKQLSGFVQRILKSSGAAEDGHLLWLLLFAQLAGFHSRSSRLPALPPTQAVRTWTLAASADSISKTADLPQGEHEGKSNRPWSATSADAAKKRCWLC